MMTRTAPLAAVTLALLTMTGCVAPPLPTPSTVSPSAPVATVAPSTPPATTAIPAPEESAKGLDPVGAYEACMDFVGAGVVSQGGVFEPVPFESAEVIDRGDGYFWVWADFTDPTLEEKYRDAGAAECILGAEGQTPPFAQGAQVLRSMRAETDPYISLDTFTG